jgi:hypothetical protein
LSKIQSVTGYKGLSKVRPVEVLSKGLPYIPYINSVFQGYKGLSKILLFNERFTHIPYINFASLNLTGQILTLNKGLSKIRPVKGLSKI